MAIYNPLEVKERGRLGDWLVSLYNTWSNNEQQDEALAQQAAMAEASAKAEEQERLQRLTLEQQKLGEQQRQAAVEAQRQQGDDLVKLQDTAQVDPEAARNLARFYGFEVVDQQTSPSAPPPQGGSPVPDALEFGSQQPAPGAHQAPQAPHAPQTQAAPPASNPLVDAARAQEANKRKQAEILLRARGGGPEVRINPNAVNERNAAQAQQFGQLEGMEKYQPIFQQALLQTRDPKKAWEVAMGARERDMEMQAAQEEAVRKEQHRREDQQWDKTKFYTGQSNAEKRAYIAANAAQQREQGRIDKDAGVIYGAGAQPIATIPDRDRAQKLNDGISAARSLDRNLAELERLQNEGPVIPFTEKGQRVSTLRADSMNQIRKVAAMGTLDDAAIKTMDRMLGGAWETAAGKGGAHLEELRQSMRNIVGTQLEANGLPAGEALSKVYGDSATATAPQQPADPERLKRLRARLQSNPEALKRLQGGR